MKTLPSSTAKTFREARQGFALIVAMTLMAFLVMLLVGVSTLVRTETQAAQMESLQHLARHYAKSGLHVALGQLQLLAGKDTVVTGPAALLDSDPGTVEIEGVAQPYWTGVWERDPNAGTPGTDDEVMPWESGYDPHPVKGMDGANPKGEAYWLVSGNEDVSLLDAELPSDYIRPDRDLSALEMAYVMNHPSNPLTVGMADTMRVRAPLQDVNLLGPTGTESVTGRYAFVVLDENVKAKVNLRDPVKALEESGQSPSDWEKRFQKTAQRVGLESMKADFGGGNDVEIGDYITADDQTLLESVLLPGQLTLIEQDPARQQVLARAVERLKHDLTTYSYGLLTNTRTGGLKKDLSLAFEMDDDDFNVDPLFAPEDGEFSDENFTVPRYNGIRVAGGVDNWFEREFKFNVVYEREAVPPPQQKPEWSQKPKYRGPTWHLMRDFYRIYKEGSENPLGIDRSSGEPRIRARAYWTQTDDRQKRVQASEGLMHSLYRFGQHNYRTNFFHTGTKTSPEPTSQWRMIMRPTRAPVLPVRANFSYRLSIARSQADANDVADGAPPVRLNIIIEPFVALWNPYNVALEFDAMRFQFRPDSGMQVVIEVPLENFNEDRLYKVEEEAIFNSAVYRMYHTDRQLRRGVKPAKEGGVYVFDEDYLLGLSEQEKNNAQDALDQANANNQVIWHKVLDDPGVRFHSGRHWSVGAATPIATIFRKDHNFVILSEAEEAGLSGNRVSGQPEPIVLEPGEIQFFGPANPTPENIRNISGNNDEWFILTETYQPDGGAVFDNLRSMLESARRIRDKVSGNLVEGDNGAVSNDDGDRWAAQGYAQWYDRKLDVYPNDPIRVTTGAHLMGGDAPSVAGTDFEDFYNPVNWWGETAGGGTRERWDRRNVGNGGRFIGTWLGEFNSSGEWTEWGGGNPTFWGSQMRQGFGLQWDHYDPFTYGDEDDPPPSAFFGNVQANVARLDGSTPPFKSPISKVDTYIRTHADPWKVRVFANNNVRYAADSSSSGNVGYGQQDANHIVSLGTELSPATQNPPMELNGDFNTFWGESLNAAAQTHVVLFDLPQSPMMSIADFQHAHLDWTYNAPTYVVGNSDADPAIPRDQFGDWVDGGGSGIIAQEDVSYLMNEALFDAFYFSTLAPRQDGTAMSLDEVIDAFTEPESDYRLPNARMRFVPTEDAEVVREQLKTIPDPNAVEPRPYELLAAHVMVDGAFNVNSTSVAAWTALLSSLNGVDVEFRNPDGSTSSTTDVENPMFRMRDPLGGVALSNMDDDRWRGFRSLNPDQIEDLAERIVEEVKLRGPFLSLSDFVNRRLVGKNQTDAFGRNLGKTGLKGTLQAALDAEFEGEGSTSINKDIFPETFTSSHMLSYPASDINESFPHPEHWTGGSQGAISAGAAGYITQADLLQALGPILTARSDTFRVRAYGEVLNPLTGEVEASAWCEAIVQRTPQYVESVNPNTGAEIPPWAVEQAELGGTNLVQGRRFQVVSFRWLDATEV
jgi:hypothetical protein